MVINRHTEIKWQVIIAESVILHRSGSTLPLIVDIRLPQCCRVAIPTAHSSRRPPGICLNGSVTSNTHIVSYSILRSHRHSLTNVECPNPSHHPAHSAPARNDPVKLFAISCVHGLCAGVNTVHVNSVTYTGLLECAHPLPDVRDELSPSVRP